MKGAVPGDYGFVEDQSSSWPYQRGGFYWSSVWWFNWRRCLPVVMGCSKEEVTVPVFFRGPFFGGFY